MRIVLFTEDVRIEGNFILGVSNRYVVVPPPGNAENYRVVTKLGDKKECLFHVVSDLKLGADNVHNLAGDHQPSIYNLEITRFLQGNERELVAMGECFIHKSKACSAVIEKGEAGNHLRGITSKLASNNEMLSLQMPFFHRFI